MKRNAEQAKEEVTKVAEALVTLCDAADFPGASKASGEVPPNWHPCFHTHAEGMAALRRLARRLGVTGVNFGG